MSLFDMFKAEADDVKAAVEEINIDKIVEYLTERMSGIDERMDEVENKLSGANREMSARTDALYSELW